MKSNGLKGWLRQIYDTKDEEILCSECLDRVSHFVDMELSGADARAEQPQVGQHLEQCSACREEYETLRDLARLEDEGGVPSQDDLRDSIR